MPRSPRKRSVGSGAMPNRSNASAENTVLAEPVSTRTSATSMESPLWLTVTVRNGRLSRRVSFMTPTEAHPWALFTFQYGIHGMNEVELSRGMSGVHFPVAAKVRRSVRASLDHGDSVQYPAMLLGVGLERLDDAPLIG